MAGLAKHFSVLHLPGQRWSASSCRIQSLVGKISADWRTFSENPTKRGLPAWIGIALALGSGCWNLTGCRYK